MQRRRPRATTLNAGLCENSVHGSTQLTTDGWEVHKMNYLTVRPELRRRAPDEFPHSLTQ